MSSYEQSKQTIYDQTLDILRKAHDTYDRKAEDLRIKGTLALCNFFYADTSKDKKIPYQYEITNQPKFTEPASRVMDATGYILPTLSKMQSKLWITSKTNQMIGQLESEQQAIQQQRQTMLSPQQVATDIKNKTGIVEKLTGLIKKKPQQEFDITNPYHFYIQIYRNGVGVIENFRLVCEYQAYAVRVLPTFFDFDGFEEYKKYHISKFEFEVVPDLLRIYREYIVQSLETEKQLAMQVLTAHQKEMFQTRNDMMLSMQSQNL